MIKRVPILFLIDQLKAAGTQRNLLEIVKSLDAQKFDVHVITLRGGGVLETQLSDAGISLVTLNVRKAYGISGLKALMFLKRYMRENGIQIIHNFFLQADLLGTIAANLAGVKTILSARRDEGFWRTTRQLSLNKFMNRWVTKIVVNSEAVRRSVIRDENVTPERIDLIYNGIDTNFYQQNQSLREKTRKELLVNPDQVVIGTIANMNHPVKGYAYLVEAIPHVISAAPNALFLFIGDGYLRSHLEELAKNLKVRQYIRFLGSRSDIHALLSAIDISCHPSLSEGFSNALLEASSMEKPIVATNVGGNPEILIDKKTGLVIPPSSHSAISDALLKLIENPAQAKEYGRAARDRVQKKFELAAMKENYEAYYESISLHSKANKKRILYLIWSLDQGGAEQVVMNLVNGLRETEYEPIVCCLNEKGRYAHELEKFGVSVTALHKKGAVDISFLMRLIRFIKKERVSLIHTHLFTSNLWGRIAAFVTRVPVISTEHNVDQWKENVHFMLDRRLAPVNRKLVFVSQKVEEFYKDNLKTLNGKAKVIYNGIDVDKFSDAHDSSKIRSSLGISPDAFVVGIVGRLVPQKAHKNFISAMKLVKEQKPNAVGLIIGEGEMQQELQDFCVEQKMQDHIIFTGFSTEMTAMYKSMDLFVLSSLREGFPMTMLEAMAASVPVISTDVGGVAECINHEKNGLLVKANDILELARAILKIMDNQSLRKEIVETAYKRVCQDFSLETMTNQHKELYAEVLAS